MLGGPQDVRSRMFEGASAKDDILAPERGSFEGETTRLRRENSILKEQLQRSLKELKCYQLKYPSAYVNVAHTDSDELPPWVSSPDIMAPLFESYDTRVKELESIVNHQSEQLKAQSANIQTVVAENEDLREMQLQHLRNQPSTANNDNMLSPDGPLHAEVLAEMTERVDILMAETTLMTEQKSILSAEMTGLQNELQQRSMEVDLLSEQLSRTSQELQACAEQGVQTEKERDEAAAQAVSLSDALGRMDGEMESLREQLLLWQQKGSDADAAVAELKKTIRDTAGDAEESATACMRRTKVAEDRVKKLHVQLAKAGGDNEAAQEVIRKLRREYQSTRQDAEGMLQVMSGLERQLTEYSEREAEVERATRSGREAVEEALTDRDRAVAREDQARREIVGLLEERKRFLERRQADMDAAMEQARVKSQEQVRHCETEMRSIVEASVKSQTEADKQIREGKSATDTLRRLEHVHSDECRSLENTIKELRDSLAAALISKDEEASKKVDVVEMNKELRQVVDKLRLDLDSIQGQLNASERSRLSEVSTLKSTVREQQKDLLEKTRAIGRKAKDFDDLLEESEMKLGQTVARLQEDAARTQNRLDVAEGAVKDAQAAASAEEQRMQGLVDSLREKNTNLVGKLEGNLRTEVDNGRRLTSSNRELAANSTLLAEEKGMLVVVIEDARSTISDLQEDLISARDTILDLTEALSDSHTAREEASDRASKVLEALEPRSSSSKSRRSASSRIGAAAHEEKEREVAE